MKSWVDISGARLGENLRAIQSATGTAVEVLAVVKANGYGHDAALCAPVLVAAGARWLGVSDVEEGARVRETLGESSTRLLVMCGMALADAPEMALHGLTPVVWTSEQVGAMERAARGAGHRLNVHLEIDTGMARQGALPGPELALVLERLAASRWVGCEGVMSHLCAAEVAGSEITERQRERFAEALEQVTAAGIKPDYIHLGNSSAVDEGSTMAWVRDTAKKMGAKPMVRTGLAIYGSCLPIEGATSSAKKGRQAVRSGLAARLKPAMTWKTRILDLREIEDGATVGYGAIFTAKGPMRLALLPVGYADGFRREASSGLGNGWVMIGGEKSPVVGRVSMNLTVVDVTSRPNVTVGGEAVLLGEGVSVEDHAAWCETIPYDILCGIKAKFTLR